MESRLLYKIRTIFFFFFNSRYIPKLSPQFVSSRSKPHRTGPTSGSERRRNLDPKFFPGRSEPRRTGQPPVQNSGDRVGTPFFLRFTTSGPDGRPAALLRRWARDSVPAVLRVAPAPAPPPPPAEEPEEVSEADSRMESGVSWPSSSSHELGSGRNSHSRSSLASPPSLLNSSFTCSRANKAAIITESFIS